MHIKIVITLNKNYSNCTQYDNKLHFNNYEPKFSVTKYFKLNIVNINESLLELLVKI